MKGKRITALIMAALFMLSVLVAGPAAATGKKFDFKKDPKVCLKVVKVVKFDKKKTFKKAKFFWVKKSIAWKLWKVKVLKVDDDKFIFFKVLKKKDVGTKKDCFAKNKGKKKVFFFKWWLLIHDWNKVDDGKLIKLLLKLNFDDLDISKVIKFLVFKLDLELDKMVTVLLGLGFPVADIIGGLEPDAFGFEFADVLAALAAQVDLGDLADALAELGITVDCDLLDIIAEANPGVNVVLELESAGVTVDCD